MTHHFLFLYSLSSSGLTHVQPPRLVCLFGSCSSFRLHPCFPISFQFCHGIHFNRRTRWLLWSTRVVHPDFIRFFLSFYLSMAYWCPPTASPIPDSSASNLSLFTPVFVFVKITCHVSFSCFYGSVLPCQISGVALNTPRFKNNLLLFPLLCCF